MAEPSNSESFLHAIGEAIGGFISAIPGAIGSFFGGVGAGAGVHGLLDWIALVLGLALLLSVIRGVKRGRVVGPALRGFLGVVLIGWAVT